MSAAKRPVEELAAKNRVRKQKAWGAYRNRVRELKGAPCADCGQTFPWYVMDFDHVRGEKSFAISEGVVSLKKLEAEAAKCDVVCANCHRIRTYVRQQWYAQGRDRTSDVPTHHVGSSSTEVPAQVLARDGVEPPASPPLRAERSSDELPGLETTAPRPAVRLSRVLLEDDADERGS